MNKKLKTLLIYLGIKTEMIWLIATIYSYIKADLFLIRLYRNKIKV